MYYPVHLLLDGTHQEATVCLHTAVPANAVPTVRAVADAGQTRTHTRGEAGCLGGEPRRRAAGAHHRRGAGEGSGAGVHVTVCAGLAAQKARAVEAGVAAPRVGGGDGGKGQTIGH
jgi:hypothetical protein